MGGSWRGLLYWVSFCVRGNICNIYVSIYVYLIYTYKHVYYVYIRYNFGFVEIDYSGSDALPSVWASAIDVDGSEVRKSVKRNLP
jgi:hypothetical protein